MNTPHDHDHDRPAGPPLDHRPLSYWLRIVDGLIARDVSSALDEEGITRREWMLLRAIAGDSDAPGFAERIARKPHRLHLLTARGWVAEREGRWTLTDDGEAAKARLDETASALRSRIAAAVPPEDFATTMTSLEAIARELGWDESSWMPGPGRRPGSGRSGPWGRPFGFTHRGFAHRGFEPHGAHCS